MATRPEWLSSSRRYLPILLELQAVQSLAEKSDLRKIFHTLENNEKLLQFLVTKRVIGESIVTKMKRKMTEDSSMADMLFDYAEDNFTLESLTDFCMHLDSYGSANFKPKLCEVAKSVMDIIREPRPEWNISIDTDPLNDTKRRAVHLNDLIVESLCDPVKVDVETVMKYPTRMYKSGSLRNSIATAPMELKLPRNLKLENKFDKILVSVKAELCRLSSSRLDKPKFLRLCDSIALKCCRERAHGGCLPILDTPEAAYTCIVKESDVFDPVVVHQVIDEMENASLKSQLKDYEGDLKSFSCTTLTSISHLTTSLQPCDDNHAHMAVLCSEEEVLLSGINKMKYYFKEHLELDDIFFEGYHIGCTVVYFTISKKGMPYLLSNILSQAEELQKQFSLTHLIVFNNFVCDLGQKTISDDTQRLPPPECQTVAQDLTSKDDTESTDDVTAPGPSGSKRSPSIGDQTPPPKRSKSSIALLALTDKMDEPLFSRLKLIRSPPRDENPSSERVKSNIDEMTAPGPSGSTRSPSIGDQTPPPKRSKSNEGIGAVENLLPYIPYFVAHLDFLGTVLGIGNHAQAIVQGNQSADSKCLQILNIWFNNCPNATWKMFCDALKKYNQAFADVRMQIQRDHGIVTQEEATHTLTGEEVDQLKQFKVSEGSVVWMMLGVTGAGKSCMGNFILGQDKSFPESPIMAISETERAAFKCFAFDSENLCVIDTPGLGDAKRVGILKSGAEGIAYDYYKLATELTKVAMMVDQGINAFLIVVPAHHREHHGLKALLDFCNIIGAYWNHSILVVTHGKELGKNEEEQKAEFHAVLAHPKGPAPLKNVLDKVSGRLVIVESKDWIDQPGYHRSVVGKIMKYSKEITEQHGSFKDELQSIGREAYEKAKLELRNEFEDMKSRDAQSAVFQSTFKHVRDVVYRLVRITMADGEDVDKMREMYKVKEEELNEVRKQRDTFQRRLEEYLKKPIFKDRLVTVSRRGGLHKFKWLYSAEATDEGTGSRAKANKYKSKDRAVKHAKQHLKAVLLEKGIIRKDD